MFIVGKSEVRCVLTRYLENSITTSRCNFLLVVTFIIQDYAIFYLKILKKHTQLTVYFKGDRGDIKLKCGETICSVRRMHWQMRTVVMVPLLSLLHFIDTSRIDSLESEYSSL